MEWNIYLKIMTVSAHFGISVLLVRIQRIEAEISHALGKLNNQLIWVIIAAQESMTLMPSGSLSGLLQMCVVAISNFPQQDWN